MDDTPNEKPTHAKRDWKGTPPGPPAGIPADAPAGAPVGVPLIDHVSSAISLPGFGASYAETVREIAATRAGRIISLVPGIRASDGIPTSCSVSVAITRRRETTFYDLLEVADRALYQSKARHRGTHTTLNAD